MSFVKGTLLVAGGAAIGGVVAATATAKAIADYVKSDEFWDGIRPQRKTGYPIPEEVVFEHRRDAETVLDELMEVIARYGFASIADFYDVAGVTCRTFSANKYGWLDVRTVKVVRVRDGYIIKFPRPIEIN